MHVVLNHTSFFHCHCHGLASFHHCLVFKVIRTTFHSLEVEYCHFKTTLALASSLIEMAVCSHAYSSTWSRQQETGRWPFRGSELAGCVRSLFFLRHLFSRCLCFGISSGQRIALETLDSEHSSLITQCVFSRAAQKVMLGFMSCRGLLTGVPPTKTSIKNCRACSCPCESAESWDKISVSCARLEYYGPYLKEKEKHHLKHFNCSHMWSGS